MTLKHVEEIAAAVGGTITSVGGPLSDGSGFATVSFPLPKDHWIYAPRCQEWDQVRDESADCPHPILDNSKRQAVIEAMRWAIRGATMRGQEMDFDPDALALNAAYALCGPCGRSVPIADRIWKATEGPTGAAPQSEPEAKS